MRQKNIENSVSRVFSGGRRVQRIPFSLDPYLNFWNSEKNFDPLPTISMCTILYSHRISLCLKNEKILKIHVFDCAIVFSVFDLV